MKKIIGIILIITILFSTLAFAEEEFTLHNGTKFGMEPSEVEKIEAENGLTLEIEADENEGVHSCFYLHGETKIANCDSTAIWYKFKDDALYQLLYRFDGDDSYIGIENSLIIKYGETAYSSITGIAFPTVGDIFTPFESYSTGGATYDRRDYSHRLIQISDSEYVFIEHYILAYLFKPTNFTQNYHCLRYTAVDAEIAQLILNSIQKVNDDL